MTKGAKKETCYMCDKLEISREDVPPKCLFPEKKDLPKGFDLRKNLIKVPSCEDHNLKKSLNDEYLLVILVPHINNNSTALKHFKSKVMRTLKHSGGLRAKLFQSIAPVTINNEETGIIFSESDRINSVFRHIAKGIHYWHFGEKWFDNIIITSATRVFLTEKDKLISNQVAFSARKVLESQKTYGDNPEVFFYQAFKSSTPKLTVLRLVFYEGIEVFAVSGTAVDKGLEQFVQKMKT